MRVLSNYRVPAVTAADLSGLGTTAIRWIATDRLRESASGGFRVFPPQRFVSLQ